MERKKILVIDDEEDLCKLMKMNLESSGEFEVAIAFSGKEGVEKTKHTIFDLIITDFNMPEMNGEEVLNEIKEKNPTLPILLFSIYHDDASTLTSRVRRWADGIIIKPIEHSQLQKTIKDILDSKSKL